MARKAAGLGRKHPQIDIAVKRLFLDPENPRLSEEIQGKKEMELLRELELKFSLKEIADSMASNGYFDEEPLIAIPKKLPDDLQTLSDINSKKFLDYIQDETTEMIVVEGNRRLATIKLLLDSQLRESLRIKNWPSLNPDVEQDLKVVPVIVYHKRPDVVPYLGVRHIAGIQKWDLYAKARYVAKMVEDGWSIDEIKSQVGDQTGALIKNYICYKLLEQADSEFQFNFIKAKEDFSLLSLAIGQGSIKRYVGLPSKLSTVDPDAPISPNFLSNFHDVIIWMYGDGKSRPVIRESRDITNYLSAIVSSPEAVAYLKDTADIQGAWDRTDGEETMVLKYLKSANRNLEVVLGIAHRHKTDDVMAAAEKCHETTRALVNTFRISHD